MHIFLNGRMVRCDTAKVSVHDAGLQHAVGLFETMAARHGRVFRLKQHIDRLRGSAEALGLATAPSAKKLTEAVKKTLRRNKLESARVRLTVTAGPISLLKGEGEPAPPKPTIMVIASEPTIYDPAYFERGVTVIIAGPLANPFDPMAGHKTLSYWSNLRTLRRAAAAGAGEAIRLNITNHLAAACISNVFLVKDGQLLTPFARGEEVEGALPAPVLPGITRAAVIDLAEQESIPVIRRMLTVEDLLGADEVFLTNSGWHVLPVTKVEKATIGDGKVGPMTGLLRKALLDAVEQETGEER